VQVESELGRGSSFRLYLRPAESGMPKEEDSFGGAAARPMPPRFDPPPNILLVDDEIALRQIASMQLKAMGAKVTTAPNAEKGLELYLKADPKPDLIILDMNMPGMGGAEFLETLQVLETPPRVLISTGYSDQEIPSVGQGPVAGHLLKPYTQDKLLEAVHRALGREGPEA